MIRFAENDIREGLNSIKVGIHNICYALHNGKREKINVPFKIDISIINSIIKNMFKYILYADSKLIILEENKPDIIIEFKNDKTVFHV